MQRPERYAYSNEEQYKEAVTAFNEWALNRQEEMRQERSDAEAQAIFLKKRLKLRIILGVSLGLLSIILLTTLVSSFYTVEEGHIGIVKRFSEAKSQVNPGLHFKLPYVEQVEEIEVRTRKNVEEMASATFEQMPITVKVSVNWTVDKEAGLDLFKRYGGLAQFESTILDPRFRSATKFAMPKYTAEQLIQDRASAINTIEQRLIEEMQGFPVAVVNIQIENISLPPKYLKSIETKQTAKNLADAEKFNLATQKLVAAQQTNIADAQAKGIDLVAAAEARSIKIKGVAKAELIDLRGAAEARAIKAKAEALKDNPLIIDLTKAQNWDGALPKWTTGGGEVPFINIEAP